MRFLSCFSKPSIIMKFIPYTFLVVIKNTEIGNICNNKIESLNSLVKKSLINQGAVINNNIEINKDVYMLNFANELCLSILLDKNGKNVREIIFINCCEILTNLFPASSNPLETGPPKTPKSITEKLLYKFGMILFI